MNTLTTEGYIAIPVQEVQLLQIKRWKPISGKSGVDIKVNFAGVGLYDAAFDAYIKQFLQKRGQSSGGSPVVFVEELEVAFLDRGLQAGSLKSRVAGGIDRLMFSVSFPDGDQVLESFLDDIVPFLSGYAVSSADTVFYEVVNYLRK